MLFTGNSIWNWSDSDQNGQFLEPPEAVYNSILNLSILAKINSFWDPQSGAVYDNSIWNWFVYGPKQPKHHFCVKTSVKQMGEARA